MLSPSAVESARFGFKVYRCKQQTFDAKAFIKAVHAARADLVVLRLPTGEREALERLRRAGGGGPLSRADIRIGEIKDLENIQQGVSKDRNIDASPG